MKGICLYLLRPFIRASFATVLLVSSSSVAATCEQWIAKVVSVQGSVLAQTVGETQWQQVRLNDTYCVGDKIWVQEKSRAGVALANQSVLRLNANSKITLDGVKEERSYLVGLLKGAAHFFSRRPRSLEVRTPFATAGVRGTEFYLGVEDNRAHLSIYEGQVLASNQAGSLTLESGQSAVVEKGKAPVLRVVARPRDAVQWALYYPPVIYAPPASLKAGIDWQRRVGTSMDFYLRGEIQPAFDAIAEVPDTIREPRFFTYRASLLLAVGRVGEANEDIARALNLNPNDSDALALQTIIAVVQNEKDKALGLAQKAVEANENSATAQIALSYALQARFDLEGARASLEKAVQLEPKNALAWARLAELWSSFGKLDESLESAEKAIALNPNISRTQTVFGYAHLTQFNTIKAKDAFARAIQFDQADPLPRLGLGLAKIAEGDLDDGRADIEVATSLDPDNSLMRSYLGKAYFAEKRNEKSSEQFETAKKYDPLDPTPYLYQAISKQTKNRPIEALRELENSIERNDNRATYRSRLLLDKDRAARGTSLGRIYNNLGFSRLGIKESATSLVMNPSNASAHRFLSDIYQGVRRREISRVSELFQAQLMQDTNINPVQPSISSTNLNIVTLGGPSTPGFNEFTPLFEQNQAQLNLTGFAGNNDTYGGEAVVSALYNRFSVSAGAFSFDTDGFRKNNDISHEIFDVYLQSAITPAVNAQVEFRHRDTDNGDIALNFDPKDFDSDFERHFEEDTARIGLRISPSPSSTFLLSFIYSDREEKQNDTDVAVSPVPFPPFGTGSLTVTDINRNTTQEEAYQYEGQYLFEGDGLNLIVGAAFARVDQEFESDQTFASVFVSPGPFTPPPGVLISPSKDDPIIEDGRGYVYGNINMPSPITWTLGLSYQDYDEDAFNFTKVNPKFGVQWDVTESLRLRGAYFKVVKPALASNRTLEPTQVAGFNQFYDDTNGTKSTRYGAALDWRAKQDVFLGVQATWREIETPEIFRVDNNLTAVFDERDEWSHRAYAYWTPTDHWGLSAEVLYNKYTSNDAVDIQHPSEVKTVSYPVRMQYFHPCGFFGGVGVTYVDQEVRRSAMATLSAGDSYFTVVDLTVGYRFPKRLGIASLSVQNLFDNGFDYQDDSFREFKDDPSTGPYIPEQMIMGRITLNF